MLYKSVVHFLLPQSASNNHLSSFKSRYNTSQLSSSYHIASNFSHSSYSVFACCETNKLSTQSLKLSAQSFPSFSWTFFTSGLKTSSQKEYLSSSSHLVIGSLAGATSDAVSIALVVWLYLSFNASIQDGSSFNIWSLILLELLLEKLIFQLLICSFNVCLPESSLVSSETVVS